MIRNTASSWGGVARALHWVIGPTILVMIAFGWWMNHIPARPDRFFYRSIHADIGYVLLVLLLARMAWRLFNPTPALPADTPRWLAAVARANQWGLDLVTLAVIMLGWAHSGAHTPDYSSWFGVFHVPQFTNPDKEAARAWEDRHIFFAYVLLALSVLHIAAAVWHHRVKRDDVALRMVRGTG
ncbi:putative Cytochrome b561 family protein [Bradyrhizobium sp. ORS 278]|uniref:cytochrome b n=1 Tax=Bradyrhizobium sp. (strain ORS 278) TaxID=114615 RepID=UPI0001508A3D|nr:cytochrome b [Bradyrhizobium sp. ORS 278]CAL76638.1 putative Cytochrome b561 family protein [Bradyrhizobium sp. ORS 278]